MKKVFGKKLNNSSPRFILSLFLGVAFGLAVYSYWLIDILPPTSRRIFFYTFLAVVIGTLGYFMLLELWIAPRLQLLSRVGKRKSVLSGLFIGIVLMFAGTNAWTSSLRYMTFLLSEQRLEIVAAQPEDDRLPEISVLWMSTSLGDISYDTLQLDGWERNGDQLVLTDPAHNSVRWQGRTGRDAFILFQKSSLGGNVTVSWNGKTEIIDLQALRDGVLQYNHQLTVPFYASSWAVLLIVMVNFIVAGIVLALLFFQHHLAVNVFIKETTAFFSTPDQHNKAEKSSLQDVIVVIGFLCLVLLLRIFNLENLYPYADEYNHLIVANEILRGFSPADVYQRNLFTVTLPVVASYLLLGASLWAARLPGVLLSVLGIIPLYLITRKINRPIAIISGILYITSPYLIAFSRNVREYAGYSFYFYWTAYLMIVFLKDFPDNFSLLKDWKKIKSTGLGAVLLLGFFAAFTLLVDNNSTLKVVLIAYVVFAFFLLFKFDLRDRSNWFVVAGFAITVFITMQRYSRWAWSLPIVDFGALEYFFLNPPQQWYFDRIVILPVLALLIGMYFARSMVQEYPIPILLCSLYIGYMIFFVFRATNFNLQPRFVLAAHIWFVPILAMGLYGFWLFLRSIFGRDQKMLYSIAFLLIMFMLNPRQILLSTTFRGEFMPITGLVHDDFGRVDAYLLDHAETDDVLIGSHYVNYVRWQEKPDFAQMYPYSISELGSKGRNGFFYISSIIEEHPSGWIVMDEQALDFAPPSLPLNSVVIHGKTVEYVGEHNSACLVLGGKITYIGVSTLNGSITCNSRLQRRTEHPSLIRSRT